MAKGALVITEELGEEMKTQLLICEGCLAKKGRSEVVVSATGKPAQTMQEQGGPMKIGLDCPTCGDQQWHRVIGTV